MKSIRILLLVVMAATLIISGSANAQDGLSAELSVIFWGDVAQRDLVEGWVAEFNVIYPDVEVNLIHTPDGYWEKLTTMFAADTPPDLMYMGYPEMVRFAAEDTLLSLSDLFTTDPEFNAEMFFPSLFDAFVYEDEIYGVAKDWNVQVLYYNKDLFDAAGIAYPDDAWTWDDLLAAAETLTIDEDDDGINEQWGFVTATGANRIGSWIYGNGGGILSDDQQSCILDGEESIEALEFLTSLMFEHKVAPSHIELGDQSAQEMFSSGRSAMMVSGGWRVIAFREIEAFVWDIAPMPISPNSGQRATVVDTVAWSIAKDTEYPEAAWELLKFFAGEAGQVRTAESGMATPSMVEYATGEAFLDPDNPPANRQVLISYTEEEINYYPTIVQMGQFWDAWSQELSPMWLGQMSVEDSTQNFCDRMEPILRR